MSAPRSSSSAAPTDPTLPYPCTATVAPVRSRPSQSNVSRVASATDRPVALTRPRLPPELRAFPVMTPGAVVFSNVS